MLGIAKKKLATLPVEILGIVSDLLEKLSDPEWVLATKRFLRKENPWSCTFEVWKTIKLGSLDLKTSWMFRKAIESLTPHWIGPWGDQILKSKDFKVSEIRRDVDLVNVLVAELGFKERTERTKVHKAAIKLGLRLCPNEVGPQLCLQYDDQPMNTWLHIAMEPVSVKGNLLVFRVGCNLNGRCLDGSPADEYGIDERLIFVRPRT